MFYNIEMLLMAAGYGRSNFYNIDLKFISFRCLAKLFTSCEDQLLWQMEQFRSRLIALGKAGTGSNLVSAKGPMVNVK